MAATAHSDPCAIFMRRIGYSVGLEFTADRIRDLTSRYLQDRDITASSLHKLVTGSKDDGNWGRQASAEKHIGDFLYSLRMIQRIPGDVLVLENLDALAIASELLNSNEEKITARNFLLLWAILVNDGEIFVNILLSKFKEQSIKDSLKTMIAIKRRTASMLLRGKVATHRLNRIISIERQEQNRGSAGEGQSIASLKRTKPLESELKNNLRIRKDSEIEFSDDYFRKVPPRRRDWAVSLDLWDSKLGLTQRGEGFLNSLRQNGYINERGLFTYWPMDYELVRSGFRHDLFGENTKSSWKCLVEFGRAYTGLNVKPYDSIDSDSATQLIQDMIKVFRSLHVRKVLLRRELPITIAYPTAIAISCARGNPVIDLPSFISAQQSGENRRVAFRRSRNTGGALSIKR